MASNSGSSDPCGLLIHALCVIFPVYPQQSVLSFVQVSTNLRGCARKDDVEEVAQSTSDAAIAVAVAQVNKEWNTRLQVGSQLS